MYLPLFLVTPCILGNLQGWEWIIILLVILLLFGGRKIPELMRGLGKGVHSFKKGMQEAKDEMNRPLDDDEDNARKGGNDSVTRGKDRS